MDVGAQVIRWMTFFPVFLVCVSAFSAAPDYYTIYDHPGFSAAEPAVAKTPSPSEPVELNPYETFEALSGKIPVRIRQIISLIRWEHHTEPLEDPTEPYNRQKHYGGWISQNCKDTRALVLIRQSQGPVTYNENGCRVVSGTWKDPYTSRMITEARQLDIDHVVPLGNSYATGGWKWTREKRCAYANFLANDFHLLAVNLSDNRRKGQGGPDRYMPPDQTYACEYLTIWLKIKLIWNLAMPSDEAGAIAQFAKQQRCNLSAMAVDSEFLQQQRNQIVVGSQLAQCQQGAQ
jgi:hypothetical protein